MENNYRIYPNPASDKLLIIGAKDAVYFIKDTGRMLSNGRAETMKEINTSGLASGVYVISISENGETTNLKFVKE